MPSIAVGCYERFVLRYNYDQEGDVSGASEKELCISQICPGSHFGFTGWSVRFLTSKCLEIKSGLVVLLLNRYIKVYP